MQAEQGEQGAIKAEGDDSATTPGNEYDGPARCPLARSLQEASFPIRREPRRGHREQKSREAVNASFERQESVLQVLINNNVAAGPVSRILSAGLLLLDGHSSGPRIAARL